MVERGRIVQARLWCAFDARQWALFRGPFFGDTEDDPLAWFLCALLLAFEATDFRLLLFVQSRVPASNQILSFLLSPPHQEVGGIEMRHLWIHGPWTKQ